MWAKLSYGPEFTSQQTDKPAEKKKTSLFFFPTRFVSEVYCTYLKYVQSSSFVDLYNQQQHHHHHHQQQQH